MNNIFRYCHSGLYLRNGQLAAAGPIDAVAAHYCRDQEAIADRVDASHPMHSGYYPILDGFQIGKAYALDSGGHRREELSADSPVILALPVKYKQRPQEKIEVELDIFDTEGLLCKVLSPPLELPPTASDGTLEICMRIDWLPLTHGRLNVGVAVWTPGQEMLLGGSHNNQFYFQGKGSSSGRLAVLASWYVAGR
jgi:hypothetical protein